MIGEIEDRPALAACRQLQLIALAMGGGLILMAGLVFWSYLNATAQVPTPQEIKAINTLTTTAMVITLLAIVISEVCWRAMIRKTSGMFKARVQTAYIVRLAFRESAGLFGMTVAYIAALNGVLRVYPAYWVNMLPVALFLLFLAVHWPSTGSLTAEHSTTFFEFGSLCRHAKALPDAPRPCPDKS